MGGCLRILGDGGHFEPSIRSTCGHFIIGVKAVDEGRHALSLCEALHCTTVLLLIFNLKTATFCFFRDRCVRARLARAVRVPFNSGSGVILPSNAAI